MASISVMRTYVLCYVFLSLYRMQMFIWNNIFFSLGFDVKDHYKDFGGDAAAYAAPVSCLFALLISLGISYFRLFHFTGSYRMVY